MAGNANSGGFRRTPAQCRVCGTWCEGTRRAYVHCQYPSRRGFIWRFHESLERRYERCVREIREDAGAMREIRELAVALYDRIPPNIENS
jgi:hypothetical protein